ncbi:MAG: AMP-binding protein [Firmicutes bacterium]|nr:AMP-binding protein [Bacillota bacterium]MCL5039982.1 AMP-binding protein [Bacillota bacterium]
MVGEWGWTADIVARRAAVTPGRQVIHDARLGRWFTYGELNERANKLAWYLLETLQLRRGDRIAFLGQNGVEHIDLLLAAARTGLALQPLNLRLSVSEMNVILGQTQPSVVFYDSFYTETVSRLDIPFVNALVHLRGKQAADGQSVSYEAKIMEKGRGLPVGYRGSPEDPLLLLGTGGTTGLPKTAVISQQAVYWNALNEILSWGVSEKDRAPNILPLFHTGGWQLLTLPLLFAGGRIFLSPNFDPEATLRLIEREHCTLLFGAPTMFKMMADLPMFKGTNLSSLRMAMAGAAPCPREIMEPYWDKGIKFVKGYGLTEAGPHNLSMLWGGLSETLIKEKWESVGVPFLYTRTRIVDEAGQDVKQGDVGELIFSGPQIFSGYWGNERATLESLRNGWVYTGDLARQDEEGFYYIVGRKKDMFISGGENVYPIEVEQLINKHPAVLESAVIGVPDEKWGEVGMAFVVLKNGAKSKEEEIMAACQGQLAKYKVPKHVVFVPELPRSSIGKVLKRELQEQARRFH